MSWDVIGVVRRRRRRDLGFLLLTLQTTSTSFWGATTLSITSLSITTLSITLKTWQKHNDTVDTVMLSIVNESFMLSVIRCHKLALFVECYYAGCRYAECRYAVCRGAVFGRPNNFLKVVLIKNRLSFISFWWSKFLDEKMKKEWWFLNRKVGCPVVRTENAFTDDFNFLSDYSNYMQWNEKMRSYQIECLFVRAD
jgi:hypothetical protein